MARAFSGSGQYLEKIWSNNSSFRTFSVWFNATALSAAVLYSIDAGTGSTGDYYTLGIDASGHVTANSNQSGATVTATSTGTVTTGTWHHACGVWNSSSGRTAYLDGVAGTTNTSASSVAVVPANAHVACRQTSAGRTAFFAGSIAELTTWPSALTAAEVAALATGTIQPYSLRPATVESYCPMWGLASPEPCVLNGSLATGLTAFTVVGATQANHAPVAPWAFIRPSSALDVPEWPNASARTALVLGDDGRVRRLQGQDFLSPGNVMGGTIPVIKGSRSDGTALYYLLTELSRRGLIVDQTTS